MVADLLLQNDIRHLKLFSNSNNVLKAFASTGIAVTVTLPNEALTNIKYPLMATYYLQEAVLRYRNQDVDIRCLHVGSEPFSTYALKKTYDNAPIALKLIQDAIVANGYNNLTATMSHFTDVLTPNISKPSEADFRPDLRDKMVEIVRLLNASNAPFVINMFPIFSLMDLNINDTEFAFIDNNSNFTVEDNGLIYRNVFEFMYDSVLHALAKAGSPGLKLQVGKIGWPTDGYPSANITNAERFHRAFLPYIKSNKGTPLRPGISIDVYIHSLVDENKNKVNLAAFQRHWGIYWTNGQPKYKIDFRGNGRDIFPTTAKGLIRMPQRWCIYNEDKSNLTKVKFELDKACENADCTTLSPGGSCSHLDFNKNVSYAFNMAFQASAQDDDIKGVTCDFDGLGVLVPDDPSNGTCKFPVEILAAEKADRDGITSNHGEITKKLSLCETTAWLVLSVLFNFLLGIG
ncbi:O-Glycosyl hydrolases family 17 protein [Striga hermonthica]|uniref:O-Glycosyl hydrolases family 17 protein n=1 Tax=Striga hermonthica TaxID=68872 RepID=A0A9N7RC75_STRHE|nr:O-Glycosyl hydrolases family 17 protein [Striga hermonthica]